MLCGQNSEKIRVSLFKVYFHLFKDVMKNPEDLKKVVFKKDRSKSKKDQQKVKSKAMNKIKQIKKNGDIDD